MESRGSEQEDVKIFDVSPFLLEKSQESKQPNQPNQPRALRSVKRSPDFSQSLEPWRTRHYKNMADRFCLQKFVEINKNINDWIVLSLKWHETSETTGKRNPLEISWRMNLQGIYTNMTHDLICKHISYMYVPNLWSQTVSVAMQSSFFWAFCLQTYLFFVLRVPRIWTFALYAMWSLKVRKVEKIKNEGLIFTSGGLRKSSKKNHHELLISHDFQAWSNLSIFCIIVIEDLVKTHLRLTKKTTSPLKLSSKRWIPAWTQAWPLPPVKWLLRSQQWEKFLPNILVQRFV